MPVSYTSKFRTVKNVAIRLFPNPQTLFGTTYLMLLHKLFPAILALERFLSGVDSLMLRQGLICLTALFFSIK